ncbi:hypothetical protein Droror1_Dr00021751 [Drosera rotundifolia]
MGRLAPEKLGPKRVEIWAGLIQGHVGWFANGLGRLHHSYLGLCSSSRHLPLRRPAATCCLALSSGEPFIATRSQTPTGNSLVRQKTSLQRPNGLWTTLSRDSSGPDCRLNLGPTAGR